MLQHLLHTDTHMHTHTCTFIASCKYDRTGSAPIISLRFSVRQGHSMYVLLVFRDYFDLLQSVIRLIESPAAELAVLW